MLGVFSEENHTFLHLSRGFLKYPKIFDVLTKLCFNLKHNRFEHREERNMKKKKIGELYAEMCVDEDLKRAGEISAVFFPQMTTAQMRLELEKVTTAWTANRNIYAQTSKNLVVIITTRQEIETLRNLKKTWLMDADNMEAAWGNFDVVKGLFDDIESEEDHDCEYEEWKNRCKESRENERRDKRNGKRNAK